jgi:Do/DeqQ family serine protease
MKQNYFKIYANTVIISIICSLLTVGLYGHFTNSNTASSSKLNDISANNVNFNGLRGNSIDFTSAAASVTPAVVHIKTTYTPQQNSYNGQHPLLDFFGDDFWGRSPYQSMPQQSSGSGVIISEDGYIVTNNHVIDNASEVQVIFNDKRTAMATVVGTDPSTDLALLKVEEKNLSYIYFGNSDSVKIGQWVLAVGNPFNLESTVTAGIVSAKGRNINIIKDKNNTAIESFIQTDAAVNPGNSGGALVNTNGELIGINSAIATPTGVYAGYSFAIPVNIVKKVIDDLTRYGIVQRAYLGISPTELDAEIAKKNGLVDRKGVLIGAVTENGSADQAGLLKGDVITKIEGQVINSIPELLEKVGSKRPGDEIKVEYIRGGSIKNATLTLKNKDGKSSLVTKEDLKNASFDQLGASFKVLSESELNKYNATNGIQISSIKDNSRLAVAGIPEGFVVTSINRKSVQSVEDIKKVLGASKGMVLLEGFMPGYPGKYYYSFNY